MKGPCSELVHSALSSPDLLLDRQAHEEAEKRPLGLPLHS